MKKSFTLLSTIFLVLIFSSLSIIILENKSLNNTNLKNQYLYIQANNHLDFLEKYIKSLDTLEYIEKIQIEDKNFEIISNIKENEETYIIELSVKALGHNIRVFKEVVILKKEVIK